MTDDIVERARKALDGVTPGPWRNSKSFRGLVSDSPSGHDDPQSVYAYGGHMICESIDARNRPFIAASRDLIPAMADEIERLRGIIGDMQHAQTYRYIGKDGKAVLARDLEDQRDDAMAEIERLRAENARLTEYADSVRMDVDNYKKAAILSRVVANLKGAK